MADATCNRDHEQVLTATSKYRWSAIRLRLGLKIVVSAPVPQGQVRYSWLDGCNCDSGIIHGL